MSRYLIDSYAWIEYFRGTKEGERARPYIEGSYVIVPTIILAEVYNKFLKEIEKGNETSDGAKQKLDFMMARGRVVELDEDIALYAAEINWKMKKIKKGWGLADSIIYATALTYRAAVVTGDEHFRDLPQVIMIK